ncbi:hypothetical protein PR048_024432 [Dryococelus australis]|uniref:Uncharacterized protein n=1 Tax=Dryococelus australis TaxID=614101 RepID=A0ABQ9GNP4_9NEOP|nr:hypothetical protein PR048_024432 [Dryococelus australis]
MLSTTSLTKETLIFAGVKANIAESSEHKIFMNIRGKSLPATTVLQASSSTNETESTKTTNISSGTVNSVAKEWEGSSQQRSSSVDVGSSIKRKSVPSSSCLDNDGRSQTGRKYSKKKKITPIILSSDSGDDM